jgi:hypothetical protein
MIEAHNDSGFPAPPRTIFATMMAVQRGLAKVGISKDQQNTSQGWKFRGIDDVLNALSGVLAENKALVIPNVIEKKRLESAKGTHWLVTVDWTFFNESGDSHTSQHCGEAIDYGDKALAKAITASYKYFLFNALCIPLIGQEFGDADYDDHEDKDQEKAATPKKRAAKKKTASKLKAVEPPKEPEIPNVQVKAKLEKAIGYTQTLIKPANGRDAAEYKTTVKVTVEELRVIVSQFVEDYPENKEFLHSMGSGYAQIIKRLKDARTKQTAS